MIRAALALACCVTLPSCFASGLAEHRVSFVEGRASTYQAAREAAADWEAACGLAIHVSTSPGGVELREVERISDVTDEPPPPGHTPLGYSTESPARIWVASEAPDLRGTIAHEMGHAVLGLWDHAPAGVMLAERPAGTRPTPNDCPRRAP